MLLLLWGGGWVQFVQSEELKKSQFIAVMTNMKILIPVTGSTKSFIAQGNRLHLFLQPAFDNVNPQLCQPQVSPYPDPTNRRQLVLLFFWHLEFP